MELPSYSTDLTQLTQTSYVSVPANKKYKIVRLPDSAGYYIESVTCSDGKDYFRIVFDQDTIKLSGDQGLVGNLNFNQQFATESENKLQFSLSGEKGPYEFEIEVSSPKRWLLRNMSEASGNCYQIDYKGQKSRIVEFSTLNKVADFYKGKFSNKFGFLEYTVEVDYPDHLALLFASIFSSYCLRSFIYNVLKDSRLSPKLDCLGLSESDINSKVLGAIVARTFGPKAYMSYQEGLFAHAGFCDDSRLDVFGPWMLNGYGYADGNYIKPNAIMNKTGFI